MAVARRDFFKATGIAAMSAGLGGSFAYAVDTTISEAKFTSAPTLQGAINNGVTIVIGVGSLATAWVEYGRTKELGEKAIPAHAGLVQIDPSVIKIRVEGLKPGATYYYRVVGCPIDFRNAYDIRRGKPFATDVYSFKSLEGEAAKTASFSVINDTHETIPTLEGLGKLIQSKPADMTFWNGDVFNSITSDDQIARNVLSPAGMDWAATCPLMMVAGNHDVRGPHARAFSRFIEEPAGNRFYTFRQGPIAIVTLDTGEDKSDQAKVYAGLCDFDVYRGEQKVWLEKALASESFRTAPFRIAIAHIPLRGDYHCADGRAKWQSLLADAKIDLLISGHRHVYDFDPAGKSGPYAQLVGGGPQPEKASFIQAHADEKQLAVTACDLAGKEIGSYEFKTQI